MKFGGESDCEFGCEIGCEVGCEGIHNVFCDRPTEAVNISPQNRLVNSLLQSTYLTAIRF